MKRDLSTRNRGPQEMRNLRLHLWVLHQILLLGLLLFAVAASGNVSFLVLVPLFALLTSSVHGVFLRRTIPWSGISWGTCITGFAIGLAGLATSLLVPTMGFLIAAIGFLVAAVGYGAPLKKTGGG